MQSFAFARGSPVNFWLTDLSEARRDHRGLDLTARTVLKKIYTFLAQKSLLRQISNGGDYWTRTSDLLRVKQAL